MGDKNSENWYCIKSKPKKEHIAARMLRCKEDLEVFCPRVRITKNTIRGPKAFTEALFPGYLFCRFDFESTERLVSYSQGVIGIVRFGNYAPTIADEIIDQLKSALPEEIADVVEPTLQEGALVEIIHGCFLGEHGKVTKFDPQTNRVNLLLEFLGNQVQVKLPAEILVNLKPAEPGVSLGLQAPSKN